MKSYIAKIKRDSNILITCEHASSRIPKNYKRLGLGKNDLLLAKDLYDPGSLELSKRISHQLGANLLYATISRLVVDYNRRLDMKLKLNNGHHTSLIKSQLLIEKNNKRKFIPIPGNTNDNNLAQKRFKEHVEPYLSKGLDIIKNMPGKAKFLISVHSFYPLYNGDHRTTDVDVMFDKSRATGQRLFLNLRSSDFGRNLTIDANKPWALKDADGGIFNVLQTTNGVHLIGLDINNKHLKNSRKIKKMAKFLSQSIVQICKAVISRG